MVLKFSFTRRREGVFDLDLIELQLNSERVFRESDVGRSKAECAAARLKELDSSIDVAAFHGDFLGAFNFSLDTKLHL